jgi:predicted transcriptional regulator
MESLSRKNILLSIKPRYVSLIFSGHKKIELRKKIPTLIKGDRVYVYSSTPEKKIVGFFVVSRVISGEPGFVWDRTKHHNGVEKDFFFEYYRGKDLAHGIKIQSVVKFLEPISLESLRTKHGKFSPPQSYMYVDESYIN